MCICGVIILFGWLFIWISFCVCAQPFTSIIFIYSWLAIGTKITVTVAGHCLCRNVIVLFHNFLETLLWVDKAVPVFMSFRTRHPIVSFARQIVIVIIIRYDMYVVCFNSLFGAVWFPFVLSTTCSFRCQLVFKCSQLSRYWHKNVRRQTHTNQKNNNSFNGVCLCALLVRFVSPKIPF